MTEYKSTRDGYADALLELGEKDPNVVLVCADLVESTGSKKFAEKFPDRSIEVGVAEQNLAGVAAGLAFSGKTVFMASYSAFSPGRNYDFIRTQLCYSNANVKIIGSHSGFTASLDGASHQMLEDIALMRVLPNMTVLSPCDYWEARKAVNESVKMNGPVYIRTYRETVPEITRKDTEFVTGKWNILKEGTDVCVISHGPLLHEVLKAREKAAERKISMQVVNGASIKPLDTELLLRIASSFKEIFVAEEHQRSGGLGSAVCEFLSESHPVKVTILGANDSFGESGKYRQLLEKHGLDRNSIADAVVKSEHSTLKGGQ